jgi:hypothetical protein
MAAQSTAAAGKWRGSANAASIMTTLILASVMPTSAGFAETLFSLALPKARTEYFHEQQCPPAAITGNTMTMPGI